MRCIGKVPALPEARFFSGSLDDVDEILPLVLQTGHDAKEVVSLSRPILQKTVEHFTRTPNDAIGLSDSFPPNS